MGFSIGNTVVNRDTALTGLNIGNLKVGRNSIVKVGGVFIGNIILESGAKVVITGRALGNVIADVGQVIVLGSHFGNQIAKSVAKN